MSDVSIPYNFYGGNRQAILCRDPEVILSGPSETGKTLSLLFKLHTLAYKHDGCQLAIVRKRKTDIISSSYQTLKRDLLTDYGPGVRAYGGQYPQWLDYPNGSRIWFGGMDDPGKTLSSERDVVYVNQAEECSLSDWEYLTRCVTGRGSVMPYTQLIGDCNPSSHTHWILSRERNGKLTKYDTTHKDNPTLWDGEDWTEQGERTLARLKAMTGTRLQRLFYGLWAVLEGAIYSVFEGDVVSYGQRGHVVESFPIPPTWPRAVGIDPFGAQIAAIWLAFDLSSGILNVYREYMQPFGLTTAGHAKNVLDETGDEPVFAWVCGGPSERAWRLEWRAAGIPVVEPPISDVWVGIDYVYQLLKEFRLVIHDCCVGLISELGDYRRKVGRDGVATEKIENKEEYHCLAEGTMVLTAGGNVDIKDIQPDDVVLTRKGWRRVIASACTNRDAIVYRVTFSDGRVLVGTGNHLVWTKRIGYIELRSLRYGDIILASENLEVSEWNAKQLNTQVALGEGTQNPRIDQTENISQLHSTEKTEDRSEFTCIALFGKSAKASFQKVWSYITKTVTQAIMTLPTLSCLLIRSIFTDIGLRKEANGLDSTLMTFGIWRQSGISLPRAGRGIENWGSWPGHVVSLFRWFVNSAATNSRRSPIMATRVFVPISAGQLGDDDLALTMKSECVNTVAKTLQSTNILKRHTVLACAPHSYVGNSKKSLFARNVVESLKIIRVPSACTVQENAKMMPDVVRVSRVEKLADRIPVYNLEVEDAHEFFANGVLVHNCLDSLRYVISWLTKPKETTEVVGLPWVRIA